MSDLNVNLNLEASIIDQKVAGQFAGEAYAFVAVTFGGGYQLGVAVANKRGYHPVSGLTFPTYAEAQDWAAGLNAHIGLSKDAEAGIVCSTMGGQLYRKPRKLEVVS